MDYKVHCTTQEELDVVLKFAKEQGWTWHNGEDAVNGGKNIYDVYKNKTLITLYKPLSYGNVDYLNDYSRRWLLTFEQFKEDYLYRNMDFMKWQY